MAERIWLDSNGWAHTDLDEKCELVSGFLNSDIQGDADSCRKLIGIIDQILSGAETTFDGTGNLYTLILTQSGAHIENCYDDSFHCDLPLADLREILVEWIAFIPYL